VSDFSSILAISAGKARPSNADVTRDWPTDRCASKNCCVDQSNDRATGVDAHRLECMRHIFDCDIAARTGSERAATEATDCRVDAIRSGPKCGEPVGQRQAASVVKVRSDRHVDSVGNSSNQRFNFARDGNSDGVGQTDRRCAGVDSMTAPWSIMGPAIASKAAIASSVDAPALCRLCVSLTDTTYCRWVNPAASARSAPRRLSTRPQRTTSAPTVAAHSASASAIAGTRSGRTKLVSSSSRTPAETSASKSANFVSVGTGASSCNPSRIDTSRKITEAGSV
jgi:hypothetical protein